MIPPPRPALDTRIRLVLCWFLFLAADLWGEAAGIVRHLYWRSRGGLP